MTDTTDLLSRLRALVELAGKATPGNLETAQYVDHQESADCPCCNGDGVIDAKSYTNFDGVALGVQFFGIGDQFGAHEALWRAFIKSIPDILSAADEIERLRDALEKLARLGNGEHYGNSDGNMIARAALTPSKSGGVCVIQHQATNHPTTGEGRE